MLRCSNTEATVFSSPSYCSAKVLISQCKKTYMVRGAEMDENEKSTLAS